MKNDWESIRKDLNKRPVEGIDGCQSLDKISKILAKYGIQNNGDNSGKVSVEIWGSGKPLREFLWSEELADACVFLMENIDFKDLVKPNQKEIRNTHINIGTGKEISIRDLATLIKKEIGFEGDLSFNTEKPDGTMRKLTDVSKLNSLGWKHSIEIEHGVKKMFKWYVEN